MRLAEWRDSQGWTQAQLAGELGCSQPFISLIERAIDPQIPSREWMLKIHQLTRGEVTPNDFYDLPALDQPQLPLEAGAGPLFDEPDAAVPVAAEPQRQAA